MSLTQRRDDISMATTSPKAGHHQSTHPPSTTTTTTANHGRPTRCASPTTPSPLRTGRAYVSHPNFMTDEVRAPFLFSPFCCLRCVSVADDVLLIACGPPSCLSSLALDSTSPLPLLSSLSHLTYLTSTSPRIRDILTCDGGLERLVRLIRDFCFSPPPPENPTAIYGLSPAAYSRPPPVPTLNPKSFDRQAQYRFSLAFQCVANIGVRGSEPIRSRVVQSGALEVVGCVLEAWLASKGFAVGPSASASGMPRETREQRTMRRQLQQEQRQREQALELARLLALERQLMNADVVAEVSTQHIYLVI